MWTCMDQSSQQVVQPCVEVLRQCGYRFVPIQPVTTLKIMQISRLPNNRLSLVLYNMQYCMMTAVCLPGCQSVTLWNGGVCIWFYSVKTHDTVYLNIQVAFWAGCFTQKLLNIINLQFYSYSVFPYLSFNFYLILLNPPFLKIFINTPTLSVQKF